MPSLSLFVVTHSLELFESIPRHEYVKPILLGELQIPDRFRGESLSENRLFLSSESLEVETDFVGIVSARLEERAPGRPNFDGFPDLIADMRENSFWAPTLRRVESNADLDFWIRAQDGIHPGMSQILRLVQNRVYGRRPSGRGALATGNQFVVGLQNWLNFIAHWREGLRIAEDAYGLDLPFSYRCSNCKKHWPDGYGRYTRLRHLGFFGERMTALHFGNQLMTVGSGGKFSFEEAPAIPQKIIQFTSGHIGSLANAYWAMNGAMSKGCNSCKFER